MTDKDLTQLLVIVDRSGSMASIQSDMVGGLNNLFADQSKETGRCVVDYVQFDDEYELVYSDKDVSEALAVLAPRGLTALLDAIGKGVTDLGAKLSKLDEDSRPGNVIVVVVTDGYENASKEWTRETVSALVKQQENEWGWTFTFLGANMDAVSVGASFGFNPAMSMTYDTSNVVGASASLSSNVSRTRSGIKSGYTSEEREASV